MNEGTASFKRDQYFATITFGRNSIHLLEKSGDDRRRQIAVTVDRHEIGTMNLPGWVHPCIGIGQRQFVVWGNTDFYVVDLKTKKLSRFEQHWPVNKAYFVGDLCCLVLELSIEIVDLDRCVVLETIFDHNEVISSSWWVGDSLHIEDFERRHFVFRLTEDRSSLQFIEDSDGR